MKRPLKNIRPFRTTVNQDNFIEKTQKVIFFIEGDIGNVQRKLAEVEAEIPKQIKDKYGPLPPTRVDAHVMRDLDSRTDIKLDMNSTTISNRSLEIIEGVVEDEIGEFKEYTVSIK